MIKQAPAASRDIKTVPLSADLVVVGGGLAGVCTAITAAREGLQVVLVQDRPVLGGNGSSEVRLWTLGATAHMRTNSRWAREGGVIDEILVENMHRNPEGNAYIFDSVVLEKVTEEKNITLLLNTAAFEISKSDPDTIASVRAYCSQNSTMYELTAPLFCDSSGDGIIGFLAGAAFRMGAESRDEFDEAFAPSKGYGELLGHSMYFYSKDTGRPVKYVAPSFALKEIEQAIPRYRDFKTKDFGCRLWWIEYGGRLDTVHQSEEIKWQLWKVVYGVWDYIKNSGKFPDAENLTLEWVSTIPGKRESRRFEGDYMMTQKDVINATRFDDTVSFGGWAIDLHPADGVFDPGKPYTHWKQQSVYSIPYRIMYSRNIRNLFLAGRIVSVSHVAFGSTRVMGTCAHGGQAVGMAAAICTRDKSLPRDITQPEKIRELQMRLAGIGQHIPHFRLKDPKDLVQQARISASSRLQLGKLPADGNKVQLNKAWGEMLPAAGGPMPEVTFEIDAAEPTTCVFELRQASRESGFTWDELLDTREVRVPAGEGQKIKLHFQATIDRARYVFALIKANPLVSVRCSTLRITGVTSLWHWNDQTPPPDIGVDAFSHFIVERRPAGQNLATEIVPPMDAFGPENIRNGFSRPTNHPNAWVADLNDKQPTLTLEWPSEQSIRTIDLSFDTDFDHAMESVLLGHPENDMPFSVKHYRIVDEAGKVLHECNDNHQTRNRIVLKQPIRTKQMKIEVLATHGAPASIFEVRCYAE